MPTLSSFSLTKVRWRNGKGELESHRGHEDSVTVGKKFAMDTAVMSTEGWAVTENAVVLVMKVI